MEDFKQRYIAARRAVIAQDLSRLNPMQRQAAMTTEGPLLLLAGAGSGKTTVLIQRVYNLLTYGRGSDSEEVPAWATEEDLQFLESFPARPTEEDVRRALHTGACGLYHLCCHNFLHGRSREAVAEAYDEIKKSRARFRAAASATAAGSPSGGRAAYDAAAEED